MSNFGNPKKQTGTFAQVKENYLNFNKDKQKKQHYVTRLPFRYRYPKTFVFGGGFLAFLIVYSAPIYYFLRTPSPDDDPNMYLWKSEIESGKTKLEQLREKRAKWEAKMLEIQTKRMELAEKKARNEAILAAEVEAKKKASLSSS